jgi:transglutaminase-like putative cysteine protease
VTLNPLIIDPRSVTEMAAGSIPMDVLPYLNASRYCQSDRLARFANRQFGGEPTGHQRATAICNWIRDNLDYESGSTDVLTSAYDTLGDRTGVCRDFAHLAITLCRAVGIPARYISAYAWQLDPPNFHAVFEAYLEGPSGGAWYLFDPTRMAALDGLVRIGAGRDAADVAFCSIFGKAESEAPKVWITGPAPGPELTVQAVSTQAG